MNRTISTFYDPSLKIKDLRLLRMWQKNWTFHGWKVEIKNLKDAFSSHPIKYLKWKKSKNLYKGSWDNKYMFICYARWLTMLQHGGIMADCDVFNYGFTPKDYDVIGVKKTVLHLSGDCTPCVTLGSREAYSKYVQAIEDYDNAPYAHENLTKYVHDMHIISSRNDVFDCSTKLCSLYCEEEDWENYPLIHFTHGRVPYPRSRHIKGIKPFQGVQPSFSDGIRTSIRKLSSKFFDPIT